MSVLQFPKDQYWKIIGSPELWEAGGFEFAGNERLAYFKATMLKVGVAAGDDAFRFSIFHDQACTNLFVRSDWVRLDDIAETIGAAPISNWRADVLFTFPTRPFMDNKRYWLAIDSQNYTYEPQDYYAAFMLDWPYPVNEANQMPIADDLRRGVKVEIYTERKGSYA